MFVNDLIAVLYGVIQGITEFLPISSSAHLALLPHFLHFSDPGVFFDLAMHIGTAVAILCYFHRDVFQLWLEFVALIKREPQGRGNRQFFTNFILAVGATGVMFFFLKDFANSYGRNPFFIAINLILFGAILWWADRLPQDFAKSFNAKSSWREALLVGFFQTLAIFPGVSRSGITMTTARFLNYSRVESSRFSFLLAIPPIFAGAILKYKEVLATGHSVPWHYLLLGSFISFIVAILTVHFFLKWIGQLGFKIFFFYRLLLGILILLLAY